MHNNVKLVLSICVSVLIFSSLPNLAWGPLAHYLIAVHNFNETVAQYANISDAWPSSGWAGWLDIGVTPYFC